MALAYQSQENAGTAAGTTITVNKPASVASGDLLVAVLVVGDATASYTGLDGFTSIIETVGTGVVTRICARIATGSEAGSFTFTSNANGSGDNKLAVVARFTGNRQTATTAISVSSGSANASSATVTASTVTPPDPDNLALFVVSAAGAVTSSGYSIANNNPTWTEIVDGSQGSIMVAIAYGSYAAATATGAGTATLSSANTNIGQLAIIGGMPTFEVSDTVTTTDSTIFDQSIIVSDTVTTTDEVTMDINRIQNQTKNSATFTNLDKS